MRDTVQNLKINQMQPKILALEKYIKVLPALHAKHIASPNFSESWF